MIASQADESIDNNAQTNLSNPELGMDLRERTLKNTKLQKLYRSKKSTLISRYTSALLKQCIEIHSFSFFPFHRISDELDLAPLETFHKTLDFGERLFIEKFLAMEISI